MKVLAAVSCLLMTTAVAANEPGTELIPDDAVLSLANSPHRNRIRLRVTRKRVGVTGDWKKFLDRTLDFYDRDRDGVLDLAESSRMIPFPLPPAGPGQPGGPREFSVDFQKLDANHDGKGTRTELQTYCKGRGFTPVVVVSESVSADDVLLSEVLVGRLDADANGRLTEAELKRAPELLRKFDLNEDEFLSAAELLQFANRQTLPAPQALASESKDTILSESSLEIDIAAKLAIRLSGGKLARLEADNFDSASGLHQVRGPDSRWIAAVSARQLLPDVGSARDFLVAQLRTAAGGGDSLSRSELAADPTLRNFGELLRFADINADERLTVAELEGLVNLIEQGIQMQVSVHVRDRGRNLFPYLDTDGDNRLSLRELNQAALLPGFGGVSGGTIPAQFHLTLRGPCSSAWAGVPLPATRDRTALPAAKLLPRGKSPPRWFLASDRNEDGMISPREFFGPPAAFQKLDRDKNGLITGEEAVP